MRTVGTFLLTTMLMSAHAHAAKAENPFVTNLKQELASHPEVADCAARYSPNSDFAYNAEIELTCIDGDGNKIIKLYYVKNEYSEDLWLITQMLLRKANLTVTVTTLDKRGSQKLFAHLARSQNVCEYVDEKVAICHGHRYIRAD